MKLMVPDVPEERFLAVQHALLNSSLHWPGAPDVAEMLMVDGLITTAQHDELCDKISSPFAWAAFALDPVGLLHCHKLLPFDRVIDITEIEDTYHYPAYRRYIESSHYITPEDRLQILQLGLSSDANYAVGNALMLYGAPLSDPTFHLRREAEALKVGWLVWDFFVPGDTDVRYPYAVTMYPHIYEVRL